MTPYQRTLCLVLTAFVATSCSTSGSRSDRSVQPNGRRDYSAPGLKGQEGADYRELLKLFNTAQYEPAGLKMGNFEKKYPKSTQLSLVHNLHGLSYLLTRRPLQAIYHFKRSLEVTTSSGFKPFALYNLAAAQFDASQFEEAQQSLGEADPAQLDQDTLVKFYLLKARLYQKRGQHADAVRASLLASKAMGENQSRGPLISQIETSLAEMTNLEVLDQLYSEFEDTALAELVLFRSGAQSLAQGQSGAGESRLKSLLSKYPQGLHYAEASDLIKSLQTHSVVDQNAVGVLLPMSGKYAKFGQKALQGIELAFKSFNLDEPDNHLTLVIEDAGEEPEQALRALNALYFQHHVMAVIGPLLSKKIDAITLRAQELGLPLITISQVPGQGGDYVVHAGLSPKLQAQEIAKYSIEKLGLKKFAILFPRDKFGEQYSQTYWDVVESMGGQVVGVESYLPGETDFRQPIDKLTGLYYTEARQRELDALAKVREENNIKKKTRKTEKYFNLDPIVDFDAVFIPDEPRVVGQILPTFAYRDIEKVKFLGVAAWHSPELIQRAQAFAEGSVFVDAYNPDSRSPVVRKFLERYRTTFGQEPGAMDAIAYDAARVLESVILGTPERTREALRDRLKSVTGFPGVTGKLTWSEGALSRPLSLLTIKGGKFEEANTP